MFLFFLCDYLKFEGLPSDFDLSYKVPFFVLYTGAMDDAGSYRDLWKELKSKYGNHDSKDVMITKINCAEFQGICETQAIRYQPVLAKVRRAVPTLINPKNFDEMKGIIQEEKEYSRDRLFRIYPNELYDYPAIVYSSTGSIDSIAEEAEAITKSDNNAFRYLYIQEGSEGLRVQLNKNRSIEYEGPKNAEGYMNFIRDYRTNQRDYISFKDAQLSSRRVAYIVVNSDDPEQFPENVLIQIASAYPTTLVAMMNLNEFNNTLGSIKTIYADELPALALFSKGMNSWYYIPNFLEEYKNLTRLFEMHYNGDLDNKMFYEFNQVILRNDLTPTYQLVITIVSCIIVVCAVFIILKTILKRPVLAKFE